MSSMSRRPVHPGEMLREEFMPDLDLTAETLAQKLHVSQHTVDELISERRAVSPDLALRLARLFSMSPEFWLNLQRNVDLWDALELNRDAIEAIEPLPISNAFCKDIDGRAEVSRAIAHIASDLDKKPRKRRSLVDYLKEN